MKFKFKTQANFIDQRQSNTKILIYLFAKSEFILLIKKVKNNDKKVNIKKFSIIDKTIFLIKLVYLKF